MERDDAERLSADDMATRTEEAFRAEALLLQQQRARIPGAEQGTCSNCGDRCLPTTVYCDVHCREDHERRLARGRR